MVRSASKRVSESISSSSDGHSDDIGIDGVAVRVGDSADKFSAVAGVGHLDVIAVVGIGSLDPSAGARGTIIPLIGQIFALSDNSNIRRRAEFTGPIGRLSDDSELVFDLFDIDRSDVGINGLAVLVGDPAVEFSDRKSVV